MKPSEIKVGHTYRASHGSGMRTVLPNQIIRVGETTQWCVLFQALDANGRPEYTETVLLSSFARWAGSDVSDEGK